MSHTTKPEIMNLGKEQGGGGRDEKGIREGFGGRETRMHYIHVSNYQELI